jgi:hypothetical protein
MLVPKVLKQLTRKRVLTMEWVAGENPKELLPLTKGGSEKVTEASEKQKLEAKSRLLDLVLTNIFDKLSSITQRFLLEIIWNLSCFMGRIYVSFHIIT